MKTAVSIPDEVFEGAERLARRTKKSRSRLFGDAVREYLARHAAEEVSRHGSSLWQLGNSAGNKNLRDEFVASAAWRTLKRSEW
jgi:hypothetical protein